MSLIDPDLRKQYTNSPLTSHRIFKRLIAIASTHVETEQPLLSYHSSLILKGGRVLAYGVNSNKKNQIVRDHYHDFSTLHAEASAISSALRMGVDIDGADIYVLRMTRKMEIAISEPCDLCMKLCSTHKLRKAFFTTDFGFFDSVRIEKMRS